VAGGTVSVLGGGKFANGAKTAAFVHLFNAEGLGEYIQKRAEGKVLEKLTPEKYQKLRALAVRGAKDGVKGLAMGQAAYDLLEATYMNGLRDIETYRALELAPTRRMYYTDKIIKWGDVNWASYDQGGRPVDVMKNLLTQ